MRSQFNSIQAVTESIPSLLEVFIQVWGKRQVLGNPPTDVSHAESCPRRSSRLELSPLPNVCHAGLELTEYRPMGAGLGGFLEMVMDMECAKLCLAVSF
jgi:hypothetical protein